MYGLTTVTPPTQEPVTRAEAKLWARIDADLTADDALVDALILTARRLAEQQFGRAILTQTLRLTLDGFPGASGFYWSWLDGQPPFGMRDDGPIIYLPRPPLQSVTSVQYVDGGGTTQTLASTLYQVDTEQEYGRLAPVYGQVWPVTRRPQFAAVTITYVAGWATAGDVPETIKTAIKLAVASWYKNREILSVASLKELPGGSQALLAAEWHGGYA